MKRKSPRGIPDFSSKGPKSRLPEKTQQEKPTKATNAVAANPKPPATSQKSGRRGG